MNLQEKYNEYKQRQEAKKFFNQNNDYHLSISDYIKMFVVGTVIAIFSTIAFDFISLRRLLMMKFFNHFILHLYYTHFIEFCKSDIETFLNYFHEYSHSV